MPSFTHVYCKSMVLHVLRPGVFGGCCESVNSITATYRSGVELQDCGSLLASVKKGFCCQLGVGYFLKLFSDYINNVVLKVKDVNKRKATIGCRPTI